MVDKTKEIDFICNNKTIVLMTLTSFFWGLGDILSSMLSLLQGDMIGNMANYFFMLLIAFGLLRWLFWQKKLNTQAEADDNQLK